MIRTKINCFKSFIKSIKSVTNFLIPYFKNICVVVIEKHATFRRRIVSACSFAKWRRSNERNGLCYYLLNFSSNWDGL